jgi:RNA polymerase sigma factor (sigma-70 family)
MNAPHAPAADRAENHPVEDVELLRRYAESGAENAFTELVRRRIDLVYSVALRQTGGDRHRAEDATQAVFTDLARKARALADRPVLVGWLHRSAQFAAAGLVRAEQRRQAREREAHTMETLLNDQPRDADWQKFRPVLDEALSEIDERDRDAILLRFFDGRPFAEIGARLRLNENAARMRVERALDQLAAALAKRGIKSTAVALGAVIGQQVSAAAPTGLAATVAGSALAQTAAAGAAGWAGGILGAGKLSLGIAGALAAAGVTAYALQTKTNAALRSELVALRQQQQAVANLRSENRQLAANLAEVDSLRHDDAELKQLAQQVADLQKAAQERARLAQQRAAQQSADRDAQAEIERMNREGNRLVEEFKALNAKSRDASLSAEERAEAGKAARLKLGEIQAKQREIQAYIAAVKAANPQFTAPGAQLRERESVAGEVTERRAARERLNAENGSTAAPTASEPISLRLPNADATTLLNALEIATGRKIVRDPSLFSANRVIDFNMEKAPKPEAVRALTQALQEQLGVVLETSPDGSVAAKTVPLR